MVSVFVAAGSTPPGSPQSGLEALLVNWAHFAPLISGDFERKIRFVVARGCLFIALKDSLCGKSYGSAALNLGDVSHEDDIAEVTRTQQAGLCEHACTQLLMMCVLCSDSSLAMIRLLSSPIVLEAASRVTVRGDLIVNTASSKRVTRSMASEGSFCCL